MNYVVIDGHEIIATAAITENEQARGLMFEQWPPPAMFFPYKKSEIRKFWMKNTISPLDIIFCNAGKIVDIKYGEPLSTTMIGPNSQSDLIIELPKGTSEKMKFKIGSNVNFRLCQNNAAKFLLTYI